MKPSVNETLKDLCRSTEEANPFYTSCLVTFIKNIHSHHKTMSPSGREHIKDNISISGSTEKPQ